MVLISDPSTCAEPVTTQQLQESQEIHDKEEANRIIGIIVGENNVPSNYSNDKNTVVDEVSIATMGAVVTMWNAALISKYCRIFTMGVRNGLAKYVAHKPWALFTSLKLDEEDYETEVDTAFHYYKFNASKNKVLTAAYQSEGYLIDPLNSEVFEPTLTESLLFHEFRHGRIGYEALADIHGFFSRVIGDKDIYELTKLNVFNRSSFHYQRFFFTDNELEPQHEFQAYLYKYLTDQIENVRKQERKIDEMKKYMRDNLLNYVDDMEMLAFTSIVNIARGLLHRLTCEDKAIQNQNLNTFYVSHQVWQSLSETSIQLLKNKGIEHVDRTLDSISVQIKYTPTK